MGKTQGIRLRSNPPRSAPTRALRRTSPEAACVAKEGAAALSVAGAESIIVGDGSWCACDSISSLGLSPASGEIGRASCRGRVCPYVSHSGVAVPINKQQRHNREEKKQ